MDNISLTTDSRTYLRITREWLVAASHILSFRKGDQGVGGFGGWGWYGVG